MAAHIIMVARSALATPAAVVDPSTTFFAPIPALALLLLLHRERRPAGR